VSSYYDILWKNVNVEEINNELLEFQNRLLLSKYHLIKTNKSYLISGNKFQMPQTAQGLKRMASLFRSKENYRRFQ